MTRPNRDQSALEPLRLHRRIYPRQAVQDTAEAFEAIAEIRMERDGDYLVVHLTCRDDSLTDLRLRHEFANFALGRAAGAR